MKRIVICAEDGSVDVEKLKKDGIYVIVYRSGSNPPMFVDFGEDIRCDIEEENNIKILNILNELNSCFARAYRPNLTSAENDRNILHLISETIDKYEKEVENNEV